MSRYRSIYDCTFGILFFGTPHNGSNKARQLGSLQRVGSFVMPKRLLSFESNLVKALEEHSEVLQNITDQFAPMMSRFRVFFFWEQRQTNFKYTTGYVVPEYSAAPRLDNTERCGIAADHRSMCRFSDQNSPGFATVMSALKRYSEQSSEVIAHRLQEAEELLESERRSKINEIMLIAFGNNKTLTPNVDTSQEFPVAPSSVPS
jgi:protein SERAC1